MTSIDTVTSISRAEGSIGRTIPPPRRKGLRVGSIFGGFLMTGVFLALSAAAFPLAAVYSFIWWAQH